MGQLIPECQIDPGGIGGGLLDGEAGPGEDLAATEVLDLDRCADDPDQADGVGELLAPGDLRRPRVDHPLVLVVAGAGRASDGGDWRTVDEA